MIWVQMLNGDLVGVQGSAWQMSKDVYDILEAPNKSVATLARANIVGIFKRPPVTLRDKVVAEVVEKMQEDVDHFLEEDLPGADRDEAKKKIMDWLERLKADL